MIKYLFIIISFSLINSSSANNKENIIKNLKETKNINFDFEQNINEKIEKGNCVIEYPKKIFCEYSGKNNKILVSNGNSLVIKTSVSYYLYPIKKTPLNFILDKNYLLNKIKNLKERNIDNKFVNYTFFEKDNEINIFFNKKDYNLIGWQTVDIYQNLSITYLSSISKNQDLNKEIFILPNQN